MTIDSKKRELIQALAASASLTLLPFNKTLANDKHSKYYSHVVVIGAGFGGATCAKYLRKIDPQIKVTLIDSSKSYISCPFSNTVISGSNQLKNITFSYDQLITNYGINFINDHIDHINSDKNQVLLSDGQLIHYDRLVLSPGVSIKWNSPDGYDHAASEVMPHAWKAGEQTLILKRQLAAMKDGGLIVIAPPAKPFRCPPGPYERASLIADYLKCHKPKSKILILDGNSSFSKQKLFTNAWQERYKDMIEWVSVTDGGAVQSVNTHAKTVSTDLEDYKPDVANIIPTQTAGRIALENGLTNSSGWCPIDHQTFESLLIPKIHIIGDSALAGPMPKSASAANSQGKACAINIAQLLRNKPAIPPSLHNTCYSLIAKDYGISVNAIYDLKDKQIRKVESSGGVSPLDEDKTFRKQEAEYARNWFASISADTFS